MKVGDYVRTPKGIAKITKIFNKDEEPYEDAKYQTDTYLEIYYDSEYISDYEIIKTSPDIIDLIEIGDILKIKEFCDEASQTFIETYLIQNETQLSNIKSDLEKNKNHKLYSIVTKEQFSQMEYKVGDIDG